MIMKTIKRYKSSLLALAIFLAVIVGYNSFLKSDIAVTGEAAQGVGRDLVATFSVLQSVTLDDDLFSLPAYRALVDQSTPLLPEPAGRSNPFDFIGR